MKPAANDIAPDDPRVIACKAARAVVGGDNNLAERLGMQRQAIYAWQIVPAERARAVEKATGISRYALRPDVFGPSKIRSEICKVLRLSLDEIAEWERVPAECVLRIEQVTGASRHHLRPDVFGIAPDRQRARVPGAARPRGEPKPRKIPVPGRGRGRPSKAALEALAASTGAEEMESQTS